MNLVIPQLSLVVLIGTSGAGKSTFATRHFSPWEVLSSDHYRGVVANDPTTLDANEATFETLAFIVKKRLERGLLTVIDATNVHQRARAQWVKLARAHHVLPVAIVLQTPPAVAKERNAERPDRQFGGHVIKSQAQALKRSIKNLRKEGFRYVYKLTPEEIDAAHIERPKPWTDRREEVGPFDLIGDIHGCCDEMEALIQRLGHRLEQVEGRWQTSHPEGRRLVFLGDLVDRGPSSDGVLERVMDLVEHGDAICIPGNHEVKLQRWLQGRKVRIAHGLQATIDQLEARSEAFRERVATFIDGLVSHFILDEGRLVVAHAGMREDLAGRASGKVRQFALYGETTGEIDSFGLPVRYAWANDYRGSAAVVYGHTPVPYAEWVNNTLCIDTGCVFGGSLTALRWPERETVSVEAARVYVEPVRPLEAEGRRDTDSHTHLPSLDDLLGSPRIETRYRTSVFVPPERLPVAIEVLARFSVDPRWLIHLPPTMAPPSTHPDGDLLEHPNEAFAYYRKQGITSVVIEQKHMGSRAMVIVGRSSEAVAKRFGFDSLDRPGIVLSRRGRRFFGDLTREAAVLDAVRTSIDAAGLWEEWGTDWALIDAELMPWSAKAMKLVEQQYAPVGTASRASTTAALSILETAASRTSAPVSDLQQRLKERLSDAEGFTEAYRAYCWDVSAVEDLRLAPFHLLATEGKVHTDRDHPWHMAQFERLAEHHPMLMATPWRHVDLDDQIAVDKATAWWVKHTESGGEGMVVKPRDFIARNKHRILQPAIKCRGANYLRLIYGPEYRRHLDRLRQRGVGRKRQLASKEFLLGLEGLERFVAGEPLRHVTSCVLGILALEAEPVDPRL